MDGQLDPRELRVSDAEREHVGTLLQRAVGQGLLTVTEFSDRMDTAMVARTRAELNAVLVDLPGMSVHGAPHARADVVELRNTGSSLTRNGPWVVPASLRLRNRFSSATLDLTSAVVHHPIVDIELDDIAGSTTVIVGDGATVDTDRLQLSFSSVHNSVGGGPPQGRPHLVLHGAVRAGSVTVRWSHGRRLRRMWGH